MTLTSSVTTKGQVTIPFSDLAGSIVIKRPFNISAIRKAAKILIKKRHGQRR